MNELVDSILKDLFEFRPALINITARGLIPVDLSELVFDGLLVSFIIILDNTLILVKLHFYYSRPS